MRHADLLSPLLQKPHSKVKEIVAKTLIMSQCQNMSNRLDILHPDLTLSTSQPQNPLSNQLRRTGSRAPPWASYPGSAITYKGKLGKSLSLSKPLTSNVSWDLFFLLLKKGSDALFSHMTAAYMIIQRHKAFQLVSSVSCFRL